MPRFEPRPTVPKTNQPIKYQGPIGAYHTLITSYFLLKAKLNVERHERHVSLEKFSLMTLPRQTFSRLLLIASFWSDNIITLCSVSTDFKADEASDEPEMVSV